MRRSSTRPGRATRPRRLFHVVAGLLLGAVAAVVPVTPAAADVYRDSQWYLGALGIPAAHAITTGEGIVVAVLDTGVAANQADLAGSVLPGIDARTNSGNGQQDPNGHGTAMAAIIAGHGHGPGNASGVLGIAPGARILPINGNNVDPRNGMNPDDLARGIDFAIERGAKVINASVSTSSSPNFRAAVARALDADIVVVSSAGNADESGIVTMGAPAFFDGVVRVCAHDRQGNVTAFSAPAQGATELSLCAPGSDGVSARANGSYGVGAKGTSMSSAIVAGAAALIRSKYPNMPAYEVVNRLTATATDRGAPGLDDKYGHGNLNLGAALNNTVAPAPSPTPWVRSSPGGPSTSTTATPSATAVAEPPRGDDGIPVAALAGGGVTILVILAGAVVVYWLVRRRSKV